MNTPMLALAVSFMSLFISLGNFFMVRMNSRADMFREMRFAFFEFRKKLPSGWSSMHTLPEDGINSEQFQTMVRYWQFAFDEWFITTRLHPSVMRPLWNKYYKTAIAHCIFARDVGCAF